MATTRNDNAPLTTDQFILRAIEKLRVTPTMAAGKVDAKGKAVYGSLGLHTVFSGFNAAFRQYFGEDIDPIEAVQDAVDRGIIERRYAFKGAEIFLPGEMPVRTDKAESALDAMGLNGVAPTYAASRRAGPVTSSKGRR